MANKRNQTGRRTNLWDFLIASLNKGQLLTAALLLPTIIMVLKMPGEDVSKLAFDILRAVKSMALLGFVFWLLTLLGWFLHSKWQRRIFAKELDRVTAERNLYQERART